MAGLELIIFFVNELIIWLLNIGLIAANEVRETIILGPTEITIKSGCNFGR